MSDERIWGQPGDKEEHNQNDRRRGASITPSMVAGTKAIIESTARAGVVWTFGEIMNAPNNKNSKG
jgi:hypothetical protein